MIHQLDRKRTIAFLNKFYGKIWIGFCLKTGKRFFIEILFQSQQKDLRFLKKAVLGIFKTALCLRDHSVFHWRFWTFSMFLSLKLVFSKTKTFFKKLGYCFLVESTKIFTTFSYKQFHVKQKPMLMTYHKKQGLIRVWNFV